MKTVARDTIKKCGWEGGGGGGGSDVKMGCTIYWKIFPVKRASGVYISEVDSILLILLLCVWGSYVGFLC